MSGAHLTRRRFLGLAAAGGATLVVNPLSLGTTRASTLPVGATGKGISPGKLMYLQPWELEQYLDGLVDVSPGGWVRTDLDWAWIERVPASFDWVGADRAVNGAIARGLPVIAILGTTPSWANAGQGWNVPPLDPKLMVPFARAAAQRYGPLGVTFEVWNEPNFKASWRSPDPAAYTALLRAVSGAIKQVSPSSRVLTGGLAAGGSPRPVDFLRVMYAAGARDAFDAVGYHPYCGQGAPLAAGSGLLVAQDLRATMVANGDAAKQLWGTEIGWRVEFLGVSEAMQASYLTQAYAKWAEWSTAGWAGPLLWFNLKDKAMTLLDFDAHSQYGLYRNDWSARPAYFAFRSA